MVKVVLEPLHNVWGGCEEVFLSLGWQGNGVQSLVKSFLRWLCMGFWVAKGGRNGYNGWLSVYMRLRKIRGQLGKLSWWGRPF